MAFSTEMGVGEGREMWALKEEQVRFNQVGREFQKHNEQCPTEGISSDWPEQVERTRNGESEESQE